MKRIVTAAMLIALAGPAAGQLLPPIVGQLPGQALGSLPAPLGGVPSPAQVPAYVSEPLGIGGFVDSGLVPDSRSLLQLRRDRLRTLVRDNRKLLEADPNGNPVRRGELVVVDLAAADVAALAAQGFTVLARETLGDGSTVSIVQPPRGVPLKKALVELGKSAPGAKADYNHVFEPAGSALQPATVAAARNAGAAGPAAIGLIDGGVAAHPSLAGASIEQRGFAGNVKATGHGTAIASLLVGDADGFKGAARGARLLVADIYGGAASNGSAVAIARALDWLGTNRVRVVNISLVGPPNVLIEHRIAALQARGVQIVAAVGNDGPAAPPMYPASYRGVVAVTAVDAKSRLLVEAGRALHVDFAAPGADMAAALQAGGYAGVRGTSFAAPLVSARLAMAGGDALAAVTAEARPTGNARMGKGLVCEACRNEVKSLTKKISRRPE